MGSPDYMVGYSVSKNTESQLVRVSLFDSFDSSTAGLSGGNMYRKWPRRMLMHRAFAFLIKDFYPEAMVGAMMAEEAIEDGSIEVQATPVARTVNDLLPQDEAQVEAPYAQGNGPMPTREDESGSYTDGDYVVSTGRT